MRYRIVVWSAFDGTLVRREVSPSTAAQLCRYVAKALHGPYVRVVAQQRNALMMSARWYDGRRIGIVAIP